MKAKPTFLLTFLLLIGPPETVCSPTERLKTVGEAAPTLVPPIGGTEAGSSSGDFGSFNIDIGHRFASGSAVTPDSTTVYVMNDGPTVSVIDATQNTFLRAIDLSEGSPGWFSGGIVVNDKLYALGVFNVVIMDTTAEVIAGTIPQSLVGGVGWGRAVASPSEDRVYTVIGSSDTVLAIDTATNALVGSADVGNENTGIGLSPSGERIYVSDRIDGELTIVDAGSLGVTGIKSFITATGMQAYTTAVAVGFDGTVYVGYVDSNTDFSVAVLDADGNLLDTIVTSDWSTGLEISLDGKYLITGNGTIFDVSTQSVIADVVTGGGEFQVNVSPDGLRAYVTNYNSSFVTVIEGFEGLNEPPVLECGNPAVGNDHGQCDAWLDCEDIAFCFDPDYESVTQICDPAGPYLVGATDVAVECSDGQNTTSEVCNVMVEDNEPPQIAVDVTPFTLWPPNHRMVDVDAAVTSGDNCDTPMVVLGAISSDEADNGEGDGNTINDIQEADVGIPDFQFRLRAERAGGGDGRVYTAVYRATDGSGNAASEAAFAVVVHDKGGVVEPINVAVEESDLGSVLSWAAVPGAQSYDVIRGRVSDITETPVVVNLGTVTCIEDNSDDLNTVGREDSIVPAPGKAFFYLVEYSDGTSSSYGTESASKPRAPGAGDCD